MKKRLAMAVIVLALTICAVALCVRQKTPSKITFDSYQQIYEGMMRAEVETILGGPARNEGERRRLRGGRFQEAARSDEWWGPEIAIYIAFDAEGTVHYTSFRTHECAPPPSFWQEARSWMPW